jgi:hypothetical protein
MNIFHPLASSQIKWPLLQGLVAALVLLPLDSLPEKVLW